MSRKVWGFVPHRGGKTIPDSVKADVKRRITELARSEFPGRSIRIELRFRKQLCYVDAYEAPNDKDTNPPSYWEGSREEWIQYRSNLPTHLCRLRYFGEDRWSFGFYTYSNERYELCIFPQNGDFFGTPEMAFMVSSVYLNE